MPVIIGTKTLDFTHLGVAMDRELSQFLHDALTQPSANWAGVEREALAIFDANPQDWAMHDALFSALTPLWNGMIRTGQYDAAESWWARVLAIAETWESSHPGLLLHKGTPYYFWGMTAILRRDLDRGYALIHQAIEEDKRNHGAGYVNSPAFALAALDDAKVDQAFRDWVLLKAQWVRDRLGEYAGSFGRTLDLDQIRTRFLRNPVRTEEVFLLSYSIGRLLLLGQVPAYARQSPFATQLNLTALFPVTLVVDAAIRPFAPTTTAGTPENKFVKLALHLSDKAHLGFDLGALRRINQEANTDAQRAITHLLDRNGSFFRIAPSDSIAYALALTYVIRNQAAHKTLTVPVVWQRFPDLCRDLLGTLFLTIETFY